MPENNGYAFKSARTRRASRRGSAAKKALLVVVRFLLINIVFFALTSPFVVFYGPFANLRSTAIGSVITSRHHEWLRYILSPEEYWKWSQRSGGDDPGDTDLPPNIPISHSDNIKLTEVNSSRFHGYLLEISDPTRIRVGVTSSLGEKGETTSQIARDNGALAAVNAGGFVDPLGTGTGKTPYGVIIHNGYFRYGASLQGKVPLIGLDDRGVLVTGNYTVREMRELDIKEGISFGPDQTLILNGKKKVTSAVNARWGLSPRTAIGQKPDGAILLLVIDGRQTDSLGASLLDIQNILYDYGACTAANLDGGSSTTMYYNGRVINNPCDLLGERMVPTAFIVI